MTDVEEKRGEDDLERGRTRREEARGGELRAPGEDEERERLGLDEREPGVPRDHRVCERERDNPEPKRSNRRKSAKKGLPRRHPAMLWTRGSQPLLQVKLSRPKGDSLAREANDATAGPRA